MEPGSHAAWSGCKAPADCPAGQTCDRGSCRDYCDRDADCDGGRCYPAAGTDAQIKVCWKQCKPDDAQACASGTACRDAHTPYAEHDTFCVAPFDPCPSVEDGICDEPQGSAACAPGTDAKDCGCKPKLKDAKCDPIAQCGCADGSTCSAAPGKDKAYSARCEEAGNHVLYTGCKNTRECAPGLVCDDDLHLCVNHCASNADCRDGGCRVLNPGEPNPVGHCVPSCERKSNKPCSGDSACASFGDGDYGFAKRGDYCWKRLQKDCPANGTCDEPKGTGLCAPGADEVDCCMPPTAQSMCDPVEQCGCASHLDTRCLHVPSSSDAMCAPMGTGKPYDLCSDNGESCPAGYACGLGACRKYCKTEEDCGAGGNLCFLFSQSDGDRSKIGTCYMACEFTKPDACPSNLVCARMQPNVSLCMVPQSPCYPPYDSNGVCDDTRPGGTRICAMGTDPDCE